MVCQCNFLHIYQSIICYVLLSFISIMIVMYTSAIMCLLCSPFGQIKSTHTWYCKKKLKKITKQISHWNKSYSSRWADQQMIISCTACLMLQYDDLMSYLECLCYKWSDYYLPWTCDLRGFCKYLWVKRIRL